MDHSLTNVLAANQFSSDVVPTVAFNLKQVKKGNVNMKIWDLGVSLHLFCRYPRYLRRD
jgi:ADP-ribosylation factor-like protein 8